MARSNQNIKAVIFIIALFAICWTSIDGGPLGSSEVSGADPNVENVNEVGVDENDGAAYFGDEGKNQLLDLLPKNESEVIVMDEFANATMILEVEGDGEGQAETGSGQKQPKDESDHIITNEDENSHHELHANRNDIVGQLEHGICSRCCGEGCEGCLEDCLENFEKEVNGVFANKKTTMISGSSLKMCSGKHIVEALPLSPPMLALSSNSEQMVPEIQMFDVNIDQSMVRTGRYERVSSNNGPIESSSSQQTIMFPLPIVYMMMMPHPIAFPSNYHSQEFMKTHAIPQSHAFLFAHPPPPVAPLNGGEEVEVGTEPTKVDDSTVLPKENDAEHLPY